MMESLNAEQRSEVRARLTKMESDVAMLLARTENLQALVEGELLLPVFGKLASLAEALRQLKVCVQMSGEGSEARLEALGRLRRMRGEGEHGANGD
jgi:hypothetical protein